MKSPNKQLETEKEHSKAKDSVVKSEVASSTANTYKGGQRLVSTKSLPAQDTVTFFNEFEEVNSGDS